MYARTQAQGPTLLLDVGCRRTTRAGTSTGSLNAPQLRSRIRRRSRRKSRRAPWDRSRRAPRRHDLPAADHLGAGRGGATLLGYDAVSLAGGMRGWGITTSPPGRRRRADESSRSRPARGVELGPDLGRRAVVAMPAPRGPVPRDPQARDLRLVAAVEHPMHTRPRQRRPALAEAAGASYHLHPTTRSTRSTSGRPPPVRAALRAPHVRLGDSMYGRSPRSRSHARGVRPALRRPLPRRGDTLFIDGIARRTWAAARRAGLPPQGSLRQALALDAEVLVLPATSPCFLKPTPKAVFASTIGSIASTNAGARLAASSRRDSPSTCCRASRSSRPGTSTSSGSTSACRRETRSACRSSSWGRTSARFTATQVRQQGLDLGGRGSRARPP